MSKKQEWIITLDQSQSQFVAEEGNHQLGYAWPTTYEISKAKRFHSRNDARSYKAFRPSMVCKIMKLSDHSNTY